MARHAGVSTTASKVLHNAYGASVSMRARVQAAIEEFDDRPHGPARGMRGRASTIGVVVSEVEHPFFSLVINGVYSVIRFSMSCSFPPGGF